ncbi:MAG: hypothetical protein H7Y00_07875 [Fimbriimonadaceae bacterium]|nr:hypothetical protein [Chitinophagales bacterium]
MEQLENKAYIQDIKEIRSMMERSSKFISLSGISGIIAGIIALAGTAIAWWYLNYKLAPEVGTVSMTTNKVIELKLILFLVIDAIFVLLLAVGFGIFLGLRKSKQLNVPFWNKSAELTMWNLIIPLVAGGIFCLVLYKYNLYLLIAPATLIFYGLALLNASKYTLHEVRYLGICEIILGLICSIMYEYTVIFWAIGFGVLHIVYGAVMYYRYER